MATALRSRSFQRNLLLSIGGVFLLFAVCFSVYQYQREKEYKTDILHSRLQMYCYEMVQTLGEDSLTSKRLFQDYVHGHQLEGLRVSVIDLKGRVLLDSYEAHADSLGNHLQRKEIQQAVRVGNGNPLTRLFSIRPLDSAMSSYVLPYPIRPSSHAPSRPTIPTFIMQPH